MESTRLHFVRIAGEVRGPIGIEQLREMGSIEVITPETEIAPHAEGPWVRLATLAICPEVFPAKTTLGFKPKAFEGINRESAPAVDVEALKIAARRPPESLRGREVLVSPQVARVLRDGDPANDVQAMVLAVGRSVAAHAPETVLPPPPRSFRWVWFAVVAFVGTVGILSLPLFYPDRKVEEFTVSIIGSWIIMFNGLLVGVFMLDRKLSEGVRHNKAKFELLK